MNRYLIVTLITLFSAGLSTLSFAPAPAFAHCDTLDGPVVTAAKKALDTGDVTPVLMWVKKDSEAEVKEAFNKTIAVRGKGPEAKELADMYFFETVVRLHRAGEGAPYAGIKPAGEDLSPAVIAADKALDSGSVDGLIKLTSDAVSEGIRHRFEEVMKAKPRMNESVEAGRRYVEAYVKYVHYAEGIYQDAAGASPDHHHHD